MSTEIVGAKSRAYRVGSLPFRGFWDVFLPNRSVGRSAMLVVILIELALAVAVWVFSPFKVLPKPGEVFTALSTLWSRDGMGPELLTSLRLNVEALAWSTGISLLLAYLTVIPLFRPIVAAVSRGRFLSLVGLTLIFTLIFGGGHPLKVALLTFAITVFFVTGMASVVASIPKADFDYARTLGFTEARVVWEVVVLGTADKAFDVLRQNAAMGWMMLSLVEGIVRSEGGVGAMLLAQDKHFLLAQVFAIQIVILIVGIAQDVIIAGIRHTLCPYADLVMERK